MSDVAEPYSTTLDFKSWIIRPYNKKFEVRLRGMKNFYSDADAVKRMLDGGEDPLIYEVYECLQPSVEGQIDFAITVIYPGKIGDEYNMTRGHYHAKEGASELYFILQGEGFVVMQTKEGGMASTPLKKGQILYIAPRWAHRTINTGKEKLTFLAVWPSDAGHDYGTIEEKGFRQIIIDKNGRPTVIENPRV